MSATLKIRFEKIEIDIEMSGMIIHTSFILLPYLLKATQIIDCFLLLF